MGEEILPFVFCFSLDCKFVFTQAEAMKLKSRDDGSHQDAPAEIVLGAAFR